MIKQTILLLWLLGCIQPVLHAQTSVLVFSKTKGFHHDCIPDAKLALLQLGRENGFAVDTTDDAAAFTPDNLKKYAAVIFCCTTGDVLDDQQQAAFEAYIRAGHGFVGIHAAADTEYEWPWYNKLVGAYFLSHPQQQTAKIIITDHNHPATSFLPDEWNRKDEWYNFKSINPEIKVLMKIDETSYTGGANGNDHPVCWYHTYDGGRAFYTALGHTRASYTDPLFLKHILGGIRYAIRK